MEKRYHAEVIDISLKDRNELSKYTILNVRKRFLGLVKIYTISIPKDDILKVVQELQSNLGTALHKEWYITFHTDEHAYLAFRDKIFSASTKGITPIQGRVLNTANAVEKESWDEIIEYARAKGVPDSQCDFIPEEYFNQNYYE